MYMHGNLINCDFEVVNGHLINFKLFLLRENKRENGENHSTYQKER